MNELINLETNTYREKINSMNKDKYTLNDVEEARYKYVKSKVDSINEEGIFNFFNNQSIDEIKKYLDEDSIKQIEYSLKNNDYNNVKRLLKLYTEKCLFEYIIDLYFRDITYNFISNLKTMIKYISNIDENIIPKERLILYRQILNFHNLNIEDQKNLFYSYNKKIDYESNFYDDFYNTKQHSYNKINNSIIKKEKLIKYKNKKLSRKYKTDIYELNGEEFFLYAHASKIISNDFPFKKEISISLIGKDNVTIYKPIFEYIVLGFEKLIPENIIHLCNTDSYTYKGKSKKIQKIYTPSNLLKDSCGYNEILYKNKNNIYPSYIICFNEIRDIDLYFAKKDKLPIIKINSIKYRKCSNIENINENTYLNIDEAKKIKTYKNL